MPLTIHIESAEYFDESTQEFKETKQAKLKLEHSLVSISKWESRWKKPFLTKIKKTNEELIDYIFCMTITQNVDPIVYNGITQDIVNTVVEYIEDDMSATKFRERKRGRGTTEIITSELIYFWMVNFNVPWECQKWHLNRLLALLKICNIKMSRGGKRSKASKTDVLRSQAKLNAERRARLNSTG